MRPVAGTGPAGGSRGAVFPQATGTVLGVGEVEEPDLLALIADEWTPLAVDPRDRFREACRQVACDHGGDVDPSLVRAKLLDAHGNLDIPSRQFSALWSTATGRGGYLENTDTFVPITGTGSRGNTNKACRLRRWVGDPREQGAAA
ncbi:MAG: hypothetical protein CMH83_19610 [Nocardioides sp.]|nr:hypothetical protein [Nocardioides sp.]